MTCQGLRIHLSGPATWKMSTARYNIEKKKEEEGTSVTKKKTKDENGKWRKMHRLIKKTIELFYMTLFKVDCNVKSAVIVRLCFTVQLVHNDGELALIDGEFEDRSYRCVFLSCKRGEERRGRLLSYCIEWKTKHTRTSTSSLTGLTQSLQSIQAYLFDGASLLSVTNRRRKTTKDVGTRSVSSAVVFLWRRTKLSRNASPFLNEFLVYLGVKSCMAHMTLLF